MNLWRFWILIYLLHGISLRWWKGKKGNKVTFVFWYGEEVGSEARWRRERRWGYACFDDPGTLYSLSPFVALMFMLPCTITLMLWTITLMLCFCGFLMLPLNVWMLPSLRHFFSSSLLTSVAFFVGLWWCNSEAWWFWHFSKFVLLWYSDFWLWMLVKVSTGLALSLLVLLVY